MEHKTMSPRHEQLLLCFASLPEKMLSLQDKDNLVEFVLHELCTMRCFNLSKAAYFIDNIDFDCFKGLAGFDKNNEFSHSNRWTAPEDFTNHMKDCTFNQKVRSIISPSPMRKDTRKDIIMGSLASELAMKDPVMYVWDLKHDNIGMLLYQTAEDIDPFDKKLLKGLSILGFCPVF
jgi:hypothetical protein